MSVQKMGKSQKPFVYSPPWYDTHVSHSLIRFESFLLSSCSLFGDALLTSYLEIFFCNRPIDTSLLPLSFSHRFWFGPPVMGSHISLLIRLNLFIMTICKNFFPVLRNFYIYIICCFCARGILIWNKDKKNADYCLPPGQIIGIAGSSGSGKTSVAARLVKLLNLPWVVILSMVCVYVLFFQKNKSF